MNGEKRYFAGLTNHRLILTKGDKLHEFLLEGIISIERQVSNGFMGRFGIKQKLLVQGVAKQVEIEGSTDDIEGIQLYVESRVKAAPYRANPLQLNLD